MTAQFLITILEVSGWIIAGVLGVIGLFATRTRTLRGEDDQVATNLITNLKTTADLQEKELVSLRVREIDQGKEIAHLQGQVKVLTDILQGRDPKQQELFNLIPSGIDILKETHKVNLHNGEQIDKLTNAMTAFMVKFTETLPAKQ